MNELMEKINQKFSEVTTSLKLHYIANAIGTIVFFLAALLLVNGAIVDRRAIFMIAYIFSAILSMLVAHDFLTGYYETLESKLRETRNVVDVAMHRMETIVKTQEKIKEYEESEKEHIPSIEENDGV